MRTDVAQLQLRFDADVHGVSDLNDAQILDFPAGLAPAFLLPSRSPLRDTVDRIRRVAQYLRCLSGNDGCFGHQQRVMQGVELRRVIRTIRVVKAIPQLLELTVAIDSDA